MAVWIQIIGLRKSDSIEKEKEKIFEILNKTEFDFDFVKQKTKVKKQSEILFLKSKKTNQLEEELKYLHKCIINKQENNISLDAAEKCTIIIEEIEKEL